MNRVVGTVSLLGCLAFLQAGAADWPQLRGPNLDGRAAGSGVLASEAIGLSLSWKQPLGSGYSGIAVAEGRAVTLYSDGEADWVVALDPASGKTLWRHRIDATYKGHDGSNDGPLSSPAISDGAVYALGPRGQLLALRVADGVLLWSKTLPHDFGSAAPEYGFATTPLVEGDVLIVQTGGSPGKSISGLDKRSGEPLWSLGDDKVDYQSPSVIELAGRRQLLAVAGRTLRGIDPATGKPLWTHELGQNEVSDSANPAPAGTDRFSIFSSGDLVVFRVARKADGYEVQELYRSKELGNTYAAPVHHEGYLYGFRQQFLSCVKAETGERVWRSRPPGGRGLILVDGQLVVYGAEGHVSVVQATPEGYREKATLQVLDGSGYTWPSFAGDRIFVRNLDSVAAVSVAPAVAEKPGQPSRDARATTGFGEFVRRVEASSDKQPLIDEFMKRNERMPVIEGRYAHFVYRGQVEDIAIVGTMIETGLAEPMQRISGTDLYFKTYELEPEGRWEYEYVLNFGQRVPDPRNPRTAPGRFGQQVVSVVELGRSGDPRFLAAPESGPRGTLEQLTYKSEMLGSEREIKIYLPAGYAAGERAYPLLVVHQGQDWLERGLLQNALDNLIGDKVAPVVVAFIQPRDEWWLEAGGTTTTEYARMLAEELVPYLERRYRLIPDPSARAVMGTTYFAATAAYAALKYPGVFGAAVLQSAALGYGLEDTLDELIRAGHGTGVRFYHDWNRYELRNVDQGIDLGRENRELHARLEQAGYQVTGGEMPDSHGWGGWRSRTDRILATLFPVK